MKNIYFILVLLFITTCSYSQTACPGTPTVEYAGKTYHTLKIGTQCWLQENLDVGTMIDSMANPGNNGIIEKYCFGNNPANCNTYGGFYQWNEAMQYDTAEGTQGICPIGWHIPKYAEIQILETAVNGEGNTLKEIGQGTGLGAGTNTSGFSALLSGDRISNGTFINLGRFTGFWSSTKYNDIGAYGRSLDNETNYIAHFWDYKVCGFSIRCLKDGATGINDHSDNTLPKSIDLLQNFPNPFNPSTTISFTLPERTNVVMTIYNDLGEKVAVLFNGEKEAGTHSVEWNAGKFVSGVYYYELKTETFTSVKKLILMK
jgi:uncharacterized protein (TIGR02145 family)